MKTESLYGEAVKKQKLESQRVGNFIVKVNDSIHFRVLDDKSNEKGEPILFSPMMSH